MDIANWLQTAALVVIIVSGIWWLGRDFGEIKAGIKAIADGTVRQDERIGKLEERVDQHSRHLSRIEGMLGRKS